jgi:hypothetical protein
MDAGISSARQTRAQHRHQLRTLTYVTLDQANGGVVRNLTHEGIGAQVVAAVRPRQQLRVRFELRYPRLRVEARGEVVWATFSGQCGIRFLDISPKMRRQINEWIFGSLLEEISLHTESAESIFAGSGGPELAAAPSSAARAKVDDGLQISGAPLNVIELPSRRPYQKPAVTYNNVPNGDESAVHLDWLSQPLSGRSLAWAVHALVVIAGILLFTLVFLTVNGEAPRWPIAMAGGTILLVAGLYWMFFQIFGGASLGARLARLTAEDDEDGAESLEAGRFR